MKRTLLITFSLVLLLNSAFAQWQLLDGPYGDNTYIPVFLDSIYYAGSSQGLLNSTDDGETWNDSSVSFYVRANCSIYLNEGKLIYQRAYENYGWISLDSGATWTDMDTLSPMRPVMYLVSNGVIYAFCEYEVLYKSYDNGDTWVLFNHPPTSNACQSFVEDNGRLYWAIHSNGTGIGLIYYSDDEGMTWLTYPTGGINGSGAFFQVIPNGDQLFVNCSIGIFKTTDAGNSWNFFDTGLPSYYTSLGHYPRISEAAGKLYVYVYNDGGLFVSDTSVAAFTDISNGLPFEINIGGVGEHNNKLYCSSQAGLYSTDKNNINWEIKGENIRTNGISAFGAVDSAFVAGGNYSMYVSHNHGASFSGVVTGVATEKFYIKDSTIYACSARGYKSTDYGYTWTSINFPYGFFGQGLIDFCIQGTYYFGLNADRNVKVSSNNGTTWTNLTGLPANNVYCIMASNTRVFAGTNNGIYRSSNYGSTWTTSLTGNYVSEIVYENGKLFARTSNQIWVSYDDGNTWQDMNFPGSNPISITVKNNMVVVTRDLYYTTDFGLNWISITPPAMSTPSYPYYVYLSDSYLYVGYQDSTFRMSASLLTSLPENQTVSNNIIAYPNPVSELLTLSIQPGAFLTSETIRVYDIVGRIQKSEIVNPGEKQLNLDMRNFSDGVYLVEIELNGLKKILKVIRE